LSNTSTKPGPGIQALPFRLNVSELLLQIYQHPELWSKYKLRTTQYRTPHTTVSDIWVRYNAWKNYDPKKGLAAFNDKHESVWYPAVKKIPAVLDIVDQVLEIAGGGELGGVLITKIPPGGEVLPHIDRGWHAEYYDKYAVQLLGNAQQTFHFEDSELSPYPGDVYTFDNSKTHWVKNNSNMDRITLIVCIRPERK
jgi:hypothetical protein